MSEKQGTIGGAVIAIAFLIAAIYGSCMAPCAWFGCAPAKDVPGRCLKELIK